VENETTSVDTSEDVFIATHTRTDLSDHNGKEGPIYLLLSGAMTNLVAHDPDAAEEWFDALGMQVHRQLHD
jgi:predicted heme/steroid binding protein